MPNLAECPCTGGTLDRLIQPAILVALAEGLVHGYRIAERIAEMSCFSDQKPDVSGICRFLKTLEQKEIVVGTWDPSEGGLAKKCYQLTSARWQCLEEWITTLEEHRKRITDLLRVARKTSQH